MLISHCRCRALLCQLLYATHRRSNCFIDGERASRINIDCRAYLLYGEPTVLVRSNSDLDEVRKAAGGAKQPDAKTAAVLDGKVETRQSVGADFEVVVAVFC